MYLGLIIQNVKDRVPSRTPRLTRFVLNCAANFGIISGIHKEKGHTNWDWYSLYSYYLK